MSEEEKKRNLLALIGQLQKELSDLELYTQISNYQKMRICTYPIDIYATGICDLVGEIADNKGATANQRAFLEEFGAPN